MVKSAISPLWLPPSTGAQEPASDFSDSLSTLDFSHLGAKRAGVLVAQPPQGRGARGTHALLCLRSWQGSSRGSETGHPEATNPLFWGAPFGHVSSPPPPAPRRRSRPL